MKNLLYLFIIFFFIACGGASKQVTKELNIEEQSFLDNKPQELKKSFLKLLQEDKRNEVLNFEKIALDAYQLNYYDISRQYFDKALDNIESVYSNEENAIKARSLWYEEGKKDYKGEPYERVMAFFYRGLLYMQKEDFENARASFKGGILQDAFAEEDKNQCDFNLVILMEAIASKFNGDQDLYEETIKNVKLLNPNLVIPQNYNTVVLIETGNSPRKVSDGIGHYQLKFRRGKKFKEQLVNLSLDEKSHKVQVLEDIYWQSTTRGGRYFDHLLKGKAQFKQVSAELAENMATFSTASTLINTGIGSDTLGSIGAGLGIVSGLALISSTNADARADTRYWNNLPDKVHVAFLNLPQGKHNIKLEFLGKDKNILDNLTQTKVIDVNSDNNFYVFSSRKRISHVYKK